MPSVYVYDCSMTDEMVCILVGVHMGTVKRECPHYKITEVGVGVGNFNCLTRTRLLCQRERWLKKQGTAGAGGAAKGERRG